ncbi:sugar ABC transporter permease [Streptomyces sp. NBC_00201]|uniref:carbohydrate ABC transporter permease n=1 Tax=unclassified Streptomyces TaxID=2593676 RepID=UPI0022572DEC|nr:MULTISPECIES: sugar ABC transporter permease [unclassified Streptomyces]MCX5251135.1 sugar ABC transporter permease [Streptomyces sp. NBC_00201]MCX5290936.1 sugar ABC transporter permease [Streptomyces sp. NBC_00183]
MSTVISPGKTRKRTGTAPRTASGARPRKAGRRQQALACVTLLAPFTALLVAVFLVPVGYAIGLSLFSEDHKGLGFGGGTTVFTGLRSYLAVLTDPSFVSGFGVIALYCVIFVPVVVAGALALALLLDSGLIRLRRTAQMLLYVPHAVPGIIAAVIWLYLYTPGLSPVIKVFARADITIDFLGLHSVLPSIVNIALWSGLGYNMVIFYAALQALPREVIEAARIDGAGGIRTALMVKVPIIKGSVVMVCMFALIGALQLFTEPMLMNQATPMVNSRFTPNMYIYDAAFRRNNYGLASAASVILLIVTCALSFAVTRWAGRRERSTR